MNGWCISLFALAEQGLNSSLESLRRRHACNGLHSEFLDRWMPKHLLYSQWLERLRMPHTSYPPHACPAYQIVTRQPLAARRAVGAQSGPAAGSPGGAGQVPPGPAACSQECYGCSPRVDLPIGKSSGSPARAQPVRPGSWRPATIPVS